MTRPTPTPPFASCVFLEEVLPCLLGGKGPSPKPTVTVEWRVTDEPDTVITYQLARGEIQVRRGAFPHADLTVATFKHELQALSEGRLDVKRAMQHRRLVLYGSVEVLRWLAGGLHLPFETT